MRRWTIRILVGLCGLLIVTALPVRRTNGWRLARTWRRLRRPDDSSTSEGTDFICGAPGTAHLPSSSTLASAARVLTGASSSLMLLDSRRSAPTTGQVSVTAIRARRRGRHAALRASWPNCWPAAGSADRSVLVGASIAGFAVRVFASEHPERAAGLVLVDATHEDQAHEMPWMAQFVPLLSTIGVLRLLGVSFGQRVESLAPSVRQFARATSFRAAGYQAAADEIIHIRESASEVRSSRRKLTVPVVVVTGGQGADENWRQLQRDQVSLSERGCLIIAEQSGHVVAVDQPEVVVDAIRTVVETARGHDVPLCGTPAANVERDGTSEMNLRSGKALTGAPSAGYPACRSACEKPPGRRGRLLHLTA